MNIAETIAILVNKIATLSDLRVYATSTGNLAEVVRIDAEISETEMTIGKLKA
jgi:hypothetical protein